MGNIKSVIKKSKHLEPYDDIEAGIDTKKLDTLILFLNNEPFDFKRIDILKAYLKNQKINKDNINKIVDCFSIDFYKVEVYKLLLE